MDRRGQIWSRREAKLREFRDAGLGWVGGFVGVESRESESGEQVWPYRQVGGGRVGRALPCPLDWRVAPNPRA